MDASARIWVSGVVQGVGFRFYVIRVAQEYGLKGITKNLADGRVYIEVEGDKGLIQDFLKDVRIGPRLSRVTDMEIVWADYSNKYSRFDIDY